MRSVKQSGKLATATVSLLWRKWLEMYVLFSYSVSFDPSLWWPLLLSIAAIKDHARLPTSHNNAPQYMRMFPDCIIAA